VTRPNPAPTSALLASIVVIATGCGQIEVAPEHPASADERVSSARACARLVAGGLRDLADSQTERFTGKVGADAAECRGGERALAYRHAPWVDWSNYWATGDANSKATGREATTLLGRHLGPNGRGIDGALTDLEYQRMELIKFNLYDNLTYPAYVQGRDGKDGRVLASWPEMRLPSGHDQYQAVSGASTQQCRGQLIRHRTLTGICNDLFNPAMGSTGMEFARNVSFESTFPRLGRTELTRNRHGDRLALLKPDPQVISRKLFTRQQSAPERCNGGYGLPGQSKRAQCDYKPAPFFNVLAAFWIQFMTHDWFSHLEEGHNTGTMMPVGCTSQRVDNLETPLTAAQAAQLGCRPEDRMEVAYVAMSDPAPSFEHDGKRRLARAHRTTGNTVTAWWDASQIYGFDEISVRRVKRDPADGAKLLTRARGNHPGAGARQGYLPLLKPCADGQKPDSGACDPMSSAWAGQAATGFADNWNIGLSFYHNLFAREHNLFVEHFRAQASLIPDADSGLRDPDRPGQTIRYRDVSDEELFQAARLVVSAEIAKIHTIEWTTQLLYNEALFQGMNSNWSGLVQDNDLVSNILGKIVVDHLGRSEDPKKANQIYSVFASGAGIFGLGSHRYEDGRILRYVPGKEDIWSLDNPQHVNGGTNHFGSPFNFPEEFPTVYRLHPLVPDLIEFRQARDANAVERQVPVIETFRGKATDAMTEGGLANWGLSMGRQRLGLLTLQNHAQFLQNLVMPRLNTATNTIDVAALDLIRDRERGVPRFNEFRRQYGLKQLTGFDDFIDRRASPEEQAEQRRLVGLLREVYGQHRCEASKTITDAQLNDNGSPINDCLGYPDGSMVDNIEDVDTVVGWLAEFARPHGFAISETQFHVFILNASRRLFSDRFFTSSFRPEFYTQLGVDWVNNRGPGEKQFEPGTHNGHVIEISPLKRVLLRTTPELKDELALVINAFDPWARDRGNYYSLAWQPRPGAESDEAFSTP